MVSREQIIEMEAKDDAWKEEEKLVGKLPHWQVTNLDPDV